MNYYNPYMTAMPMMSAPVKVGLFSRLFGGNGITFSSILSGTQKAIGFANQAIPLVKQVSPVVRNAKTMFKVMNEFKKVDTNSINNVILSSNINDKTSTNIKKNNVEEKHNGPTFFI